MKKIDWYDDVIAPALIGGLTITIFWGIYKVFAGIYHLLDKLIDKL